MSDNQNTILDDHRSMLTISKSLSDFQLENLQKWPFVLFQDILESSIEYNFLDEEGLFFAGKIKFNLKLLMEQSNKKEIMEKANFLSSWVKILFWTDTQVEVFINDERINHEGNH